MDKDQAKQYVAYAVDDVGAIRQANEAPENARYVGWQCGFQPVFVIVWSYLNVRLDDDEAEELAADWLEEIGWFMGDPTPADYII